MRLNRWQKSTLGIFLLGGIVTLLVWAFLEGRKELEMERERERPVKPPSRVSIQDGESVITLNNATRTKGGIAVASVESVSHLEEIMAYGTVVDIQNLIDLRNSYATAKGNVEKTRASLKASRKAHDRLKALHEDNRNVSDKAVQEAEATWGSDVANAQATRASLQAVEAIVRQQWGGVLAQWLFDGSPAFDRLLRGQDLLIQVTLPSGEHIPSAPRTASVQVADGTRLPVDLVSPAPRTDPRIQGMSFFYLAPAGATGLLSGLNVVAYLPLGPQTRGVVLPASAVVWWQGKAWAYVQKEAGRFVRREVSTETPAHGGWFVAKGLSAEDRVVVSGAQLLLSEEFRSQIQVGEENE